MNPYSLGQDVFRTTADERFNSFSAPSAMAYNQMNGQWGVNPDMITPSYTAAYRPTYNGYQGNPFGSAKPGWGQSLNQVFNPFASEGNNYGGNTDQQQSPYYDSLGYIPLDHSVNIAQKWAVPGFTSWMSYKYLAKPLGAMSERLTAGAITGLASGSFSAGSVATMADWGGKVGGFAGAALLPTAVAEMGVYAADKALFDPYVAQRQMTDTLRRNFSGVTFADGSGDVTTGQGFSRRSAGRIAGQLSELGANDYTFNQSEISNLTDLSARSGLLDTVQGSQIADRMKSIVKQVKMVMQVGNTSDFREAIQIISKLQTAGVATSDVSTVTAKLGSMASVAGVSLQKMMDTVGAQGQYLFGSNGMTPYVGQLAAANAYGAFSAAQRSGLMSNALLARMGGVEGATQSAVGGLVGMAQTPYATFNAFNTYLGGGRTGSVVGDMSKFGGNIAANPLLNTARYFATRSQLASQSIEDGGLDGQLENALKIARQLPGVQKDKPVDADILRMILTQVIGVTDDHANAILQQKKSDQDPGSQAIAKAGISSSYTAGRLKRYENLGMNYGRFNPVMSKIFSAGHGVQSLGAEFSAGFLDNWNGGIDTLNKAVLGITRTEDLNPLVQGSTDSLNTDFDKMNDKASWGDRLSSTYSYVQSAVEFLKNDKEVIDALNSGKKDVLRSVIEKKDYNDELGPHGHNLANREGIEKLVEAISGQGVLANTGSPPRSVETVTGMGSKEDAESMSKLALDIHAAGGKMTQEHLDRYKKIAKWSILGRKEIGYEELNAAYSRTAILGSGNRLQDIDIDSTNPSDIAKREGLIGDYGDKITRRGLLEKSDKKLQSEKVDFSSQDKDLQTISAGSANITITGATTINTPGGTGGYGLANDGTPVKTIGQVVSGVFHRDNN